MSQPKWDNPSFCKVMLGSFRTTLKIPPLFKKHIGGKVGRSCVFRNNKGMQWKIKMATLDGNLDGWEMFVSDNAVSLGDFLVFVYDGDVGFDVKIYGRSGCEKEGCVHFTTIGVKVKEEGEELKIKDEEEEGRLIAKKAIGCITMNPKMVSRKRKMPVLGKDPVKTSKLCYKLIRAAAEVENKKALEAACAIKLTNPHFITTCRHSRADCMVIPLGLARKYKINKMNSIHLLDPHGTSWRVKLSHWNGRIFLSSGWASVYKKNGFKQGDACVFEIVQGGTTINLHIFRALEDRAQEDSAKSIPELGEIFPTDDDEGRVLQAAKTFQSRHTKFVALCKSSPLYQVTIPKTVAVEVGIQRSQSTILFDPSGRQWPVQIAKRSSKRVELASGYVDFSRANNLSSGDACVFEFIGGANTIKVHIFRVGETRETTETAAACKSS